MENPLENSPPGPTRRWILTAEEKRVILFVVIAFLLGLAIRHYRENHPRIPPARAKKADIAVGHASTQT